MSDAPAPGPTPEDPDEAAEPPEPDDGPVAEEPDEGAEEPTPVSTPATAQDVATALETVIAGIDGARSDISGARAGIESFLPDLAASAREETLRTGLAELAREETVAAGNARLQKGIDEMIRLTRRADEHVAELHAENQRLRAGELASATLPMVRDLVRLHDEVTRLVDASHPEARADLELVGSRLLDTLARWGLSPFVPAPGDPLDPQRHQGVGRVASSEGAAGTIATVRRPGFAHDDGRTFRPAEVEVYVAPEPAEVTVVADPPAPPPPAPSEET